MHISVTPRVETDHSPRRAERASRDEDRSFARALESAENEHDPDAERVEETPPGEARESESEVAEDPTAEANADNDAADESPVAHASEEKPRAGTEKNTAATAETGRVPRPTLADRVALSGEATRATLVGAHETSSTTPATGHPAPASAATAGLEPLLAKSSQTPLTTEVVPHVEAASSNEPSAVPSSDNTGPARAGGARPSPVTPRFVDPRTMQAAEAARTSVFRQIALRVTPEGGEMRVHLDPPELGHLDLHMVVEKSGAMRLQVIAERPELAQLLERHMGELRQTLAEQGVDVTEADIRFGDRAHADSEFGNESFGRSQDTNNGDRDEHEDVAVRNPGYITAEGLDYWV